MSMKDLSVAAICLVFLSVTSIVLAQETQEEVKVRLRLLPVTVLDSDGKPVKKLAAEDFQLIVDGKPVSIRSVDEYDYGKVREQVREGQKAEYIGADLPPRKIILLFDLLRNILV